MVGLNTIPGSSKIIKISISLSSLILPETKLPNKNIDFVFQLMGNYIEAKVERGDDYRRVPRVSSK